MYWACAIIFYVMGYLSGSGELFSQQSSIPNFFLHVTQEGDGRFKLVTFDSWGVVPNRLNYLLETSSIPIKHTGSPKKLKRKKNKESDSAHKRLHAKMHTILALNFFF